MSGSKPLSLLQSQQTNAKTVTKLANMKQLSNAINLMVLDLVVIYLVIHCYDTETSRKRSVSPYV